MVKKYILDTEASRFEIQKLVEKGGKFKSSEDRVVLEVGEEIYDVLSKDQLLSLYNELILKKKIPMKLNYLGKGGEHWNKVYQENEKSNNYNLLSPQKELTRTTMSYLNGILLEYDLVNIFDIGFSGKHQIKPFIDAMQGINFNYIPVDISQTIMDNAVLEMSKLIPKHCIFPKILDFETNSLQTLFYDFKYLKPNSLNLILFLGATIGNFRIEQQIRILRNINDGMLKDDFLYITIGKDVPSLRNNSNIKNNKQSVACFTFISNLIGLNEEVCDKEFAHINSKNQKEFNLVMKKDVIINFLTLKRKVLIKKSEKINLTISSKDNFESIIAKTKSSGLELNFIINHPKKPYIAYLAQLAE